MFQFGSQYKLRRSIEEQRPKLLRLACSWCHDLQLAEDLVQDTFIKALERSAQLKDPAKIAGWLTRILVNSHRDHLRKAKNFVEIEDETLVEQDHPEMSAERADTASFVRQSVAKLGEEQRKVLTLVDLSEFTYAEVACILDIPIGTVMSRLCRARQRLKVLIEEQQNNNTVVKLRRVK